MIKLENITKFYNSNGIVASGITRINLKLNIGEFIAITGESGSGKSTLLNVISGLDTYEEGEMYINGLETSHYIEKDFEDYRRKYIGNIYQNFNLITSYTVYQNIELVLLINGFNKKEIADKVLRLIDKVNLTKFKDTKVSKLSGGQKQRVAIARALAKETPVIIADEPTGNLDSVQAKEVLETLYNISKDKLVIVVTHDYEQIKDYATRKIKMSDGKVLEDKKIKQYEVITPAITEYKEITPMSKFRLMMRNTFNIFPKFMLLLFIFFFITAAVMLQYAYTKKQQNDALINGATYLFYDISENRIIINKEDKSPISTEDFESLNNLENIENIVKNDFFLDTYNYIENEYDFKNGIFKDVGTLTTELDYGRLPEQDNEIVLLINEYEYTPTILNDSYHLSNGRQRLSDEVIVVGIGIIEGYDYNIYVKPNLLEKFSTSVLMNYPYSEAKVTIDGYVQNNFNFVISDDVKKGEVIVSNNVCYDCLDKILTINHEGTYYDAVRDLKIVEIKQLADEEFEGYNTIMLNEEDANEIFNKDIYQSSIYIKDMKYFDQTKEELNAMGYTTFVIKDTLVNYGMDGMLNIINTVLTVVLVVILFFISYFVIKLIIKSRNIYFSTIRMLGANKKVAKQLLTGELIVVASIAYLLFVIIVFVCGDFVVLSVVKDYLYLGHYIILYIVIILLSYLISLRYSSNVFKNSVITTINEEV